MAPSEVDLLAFFSQMKAEDGIIVEEPPKLDLDLYIQNYEGRTRYDRLIHIGKSCVPLCIEALKAAVHEAKRGDDVVRYREAWQCIRLAAPDTEEAQVDETWAKNKEEANKKETARLEAELKGYKNNLIKESIRMGHEDLGHHLEETGHLKEAAEAYGRMRHDVSTTKHIMDCSQRLISVALQRRDWTAVLTNVGKIGGIQGVEDDRGMQPYMKIVHGIGQMGLGKYSEAANSFLQADSSIPANTFNDIATPNDVATYGGLLALATMNRGALQARVLDNTAFRAFLEHESYIRKAISHFVNGRYSSCLSTLDAYKNDYLLDIYLYKHVNAIFKMIRRKCIVQYFVPFSCVTIQSMEEAFGRHGQSIEPELASMIRDGALNARIDAKSKLLVAVQPDARLQMQQTALETAAQYEELAKERLRRINLVAAGLEVQNPKRQHNMQDAVEDAWYDEGGRVPATEAA